MRQQQHHVPTPGGDNGIIWQLCMFLHVCLEKVSAGRWATVAACVCACSIGTCAVCGCCRHVRPRKAALVGSPVVVFVTLLGLLAGWWYQSNQLGAHQFLFYWNNGCTQRWIFQ
eukprot:COSAG01_NODE_19053_length_1034_cov_0.674866_1_plen_113_part_10